MNSDSLSKFDIPIVLFIFKRGDKAAKILAHISQIKPQKIYLIADGPRNIEEKTETESCRKKVEEAINWECDVIKNYASTNRGVYENIAGGAKWVFKREKWAIFLEDDNFPELSFFPFCREMLHRYEDNLRILWICGTNYKINTYFPEGTSYYFTQHMMPCGWASWRDKFTHYYDGELNLLEDGASLKKIKQLDYSKALKKQDISNWNRELSRKKNGLKFDSWDYQMSFTIRIHDLVGIVPKYNQITNIGVDNLSIHGGTSFDNEMTRRFCGLDTKQLEFPLIHPREINTDRIYEKDVARIILLPFSIRIKSKISRILRYLFSIPHGQSISQFFKQNRLI